MFRLGFWNTWLQGHAADLQERECSQARAAAIIAVSQRLLDWISEELEARRQRAPDT